MTLTLSLIFGCLIGLSLGLTGGGGAIFAVPLLVYGLGMPAREAVGISLVAVGSTSLVGFLYRWRLKQVELPTGLLFSLAGMLGAPVGSWVSGLLSETLLLILFASLMIVVALRMWQQASRPAAPARPCAEDSPADGPSCQRDTAGMLILTSRCAVLLVVVGVLTGMLTGLFGVGGGFIIVPALVLFSGMAIERAIGTSLMVISLVSISGVASHLWAGRAIAPDVAGLFIVGGIAGLFVGQNISQRLSGPALQRVFVAAILAVAMFVILRNLNS